MSAINWAPMWTLDGQRLVFIVSGERGDAVYWRRADGSGEAEHLIDTRAAEGWNAGGSQMRFLTLKESAGNRDYGIAVFDMSSRTVTPIIDLPNSAQHSSAVSPDGTWMAYASNETGRYEVWVEPFPQTGARYQVTRDGGSHPMWLARWPGPLLRSRPSDVPPRGEHEGHVGARRAHAAADQGVRAGRVSSAVRSHARRPPVPCALSDRPIVAAATVRDDYSPNLFEIPTISTRCENLGKHVSGTVVLGYTVSYLVVRRLPALNVLDLRLWLAEAAA